MKFYTNNSNCNGLSIGEGNKIINVKTGRRNYGRPLKRLLDMWDRNGSTSGPTP
jgi:hypothetical protein